jgi:DNA-3-methyladenine glycosylase
MAGPVPPDAGFPDFLEGTADAVSERLLGCFFERTIDGERVVVRIVETEAYDQEDAASHSYRGQTERTEVMFGPAGHLYVYFTYGMHYCCNVVAGVDGYGAAALIRAAEPVTGLESIERRRGMAGVNVTNGPAKLCQALAVDLDLRGHDLRVEPMRLLEGELLPDEEVTRTTRVGITKATEMVRRFYITGNRFVSKPWVPNF